MLHYYLQKGIDPERIINSSNITKLFYKASMDIAMAEKRVEK